MVVDKLVLGWLRTNCYILINGKDCILIDPAEDYKTIVEKIDGLNLLGIIVTHNHPDHIGAVKDLLKIVPTKLLHFNNLEEKKYSIGSFNFEVIFTPGHTDDSITIYFEIEKVMFTGDFLFKETIGRTDLATSNHSDMLKSIKKIKTYDNCVIYPGHGSKTELDYEKENNQFLY